MSPNGSVVHNPSSPNMRVESVGLILSSSSRSRKRSKRTPALCCRTFFTPTNLCPLHLEAAVQSGHGHRPAAKQSKVSGGPTRVGPSHPHVINISLRASMRDRYRDRRADQLLSIRKRDGVVPVSFRKLSVKWLWLAKPIASATSAIDRSAPSSSSLPRRMRRSIR